MTTTTVYYKPGCPFGIRLRLALALHGVPFTAVRFRDDEEGAARVREVNQGNEISPTVHVDGRWLTNPAWREVAQATSASQQPT
jgi:mycoredoxin